jgi:hypothetical protein
MLNQPFNLSSFKNRAMKKTLKYILIFVLSFSFMYLKSQNIMGKPMFIKNYGTITVPQNLDTIGQELAKNVIINKILDNADYSNESTLSKNYKVILTRGYFTEYTKDVVVFWPSSSIEYLKTFLTDPLKKMELSKLAVLPHASFKKVNSRMSSDNFQKYLLSNKDSVEKYREFIKASYQEMIHLVFPDNIINSITVDFSSYRTKYPVMIVNTEFSFLNDANEKVTLVQNLYSILKEKTQYLAQFEYYKEDEGKWKSFVSNFLNQVNLN